SMASDEDKKIVCSPATRIALCVQRQATSLLCNELQPRKQSRHHEDLHTPVAQYCRAAKTYATEVRRYGLLLIRFCFPLARLLGHAQARSAELHSAVSQICNLRSASLRAPECCWAHRQFHVLPSATRRYSRVQLCATDLGRHDAYKEQGRASASTPLGLIARTYPTIRR